jgi:hypothetical protein
MARPIKRRPHWLAACAVAGVGSLAIVTTAAAAPPTVERQSGSGIYWNAASPNPSYVITATGGETSLSYTTSESATPVEVPASGVVTLPSAPQGGRSLTAFPTEAPGDSTTVNFTVDTTPPAVSVALAPSAPNGANGWYRAPLTIQPTCTDLLPVTGCDPFGWTTDGVANTAPVNATDAAGNVGTGSVSPPFKYDNTPPATTGGKPSAPVSESTVGSEPQFRWTRGVDPTSGPDRYELEWRTVDDADGDAWQVIAKVADTGLGDYVAGRDPSLRPTPLPTLELLEWRVRTFDTAGNSRNSTPPFRLTIDPTVPPAPTITGGPSTPIRFTSPTFTWSGNGESYLWDLYIPGRTTPVRSGGGPETETTLQSLADGDYTFAVTQVNGLGVMSEAATRSFKVDTTPPVAPTITVRPPFPAAGVVTFGWTTEAGAYSRWQVIGPGGALVIGPADSLQNSVSITGLADGAYSFQVLQIDAAGNSSATTSEPFTVSTPVAPGQPPSSGPRIEPEFLLPRQNAFKLRPKAGKTLPTRRPVLGWRKGPRGTKLYNVQIFKVIRKRRGAAPTVKKVFSGFPTKRQLRAPKSKMQPGTCYVWRVWPYTGTRFTPKPLGISNFCVAKASVLKKKAAQAAARRKAAQRRAR